jgi:hypothetical protein
MQTTEVSKYFGYGVAVLTACAGTVVLVGLQMFEGTPSHFRIMFGVVLILFSIYRFLATRTLARRTGRDDE